MLKNTTIAKFLEEKLNEYSKASYEPPYVFRVYADKGVFEKIKTVSNVTCILKMINTETPQRATLDNITCNYTLGVVLPAMLNNGHIERFNYLASKLYTEYNGKELDLDEGKAILNFKLPIVTELDMRAGLGESVITILEFTVNWYKNTLNSSSKHWLLNGVELPFISESVDLEVSGASNSVYGTNSTQSMPIKKSKFYKFTLPYDSNNKIVVELQKDILNSDFLKTYDIMFYDEITYTKNNPYKSKVTLYKTNTDNSTFPKASEFSVIFTDATQDNKVKYEIALIDNPFDQNNVNTRFFYDHDGKTARQWQEEWFDNKINESRCHYSEILAPNLNSLTITQQVYLYKPIQDEIDNNTDLDLNSLLTKNYAIIKATDRATNKVLYYYYYYINTSTAGAANQILLDLKMDTIQTYYFDPKIEIPPCMIHRAHLNRWLEEKDENGNPTGNVMFDGTPQSKLFEREPIKELSKRLINRRKLDLRVNINDGSVGPFGESFDRWLNENVMCWVYIFMKDTNNSRTGNCYLRYNRSTVDFSLNNSFGVCQLPYRIFCYPIYRADRGQTNNTIIKWWLSGDAKDWDITNSLEFIGDYSAVLQMKVSLRPPFSLGNYVYVQKEDMNSNKDYTYNNDIHDLKKPLYLVCIHDAQRGSDRYFGGLSFFAKNTSGICEVSNQYFYQRNLYTDNINLSADFIFDKNEIIGKCKDKKFNSKLLNSDFKELVLTDNSSKFNYNIQKIGRKKIKILYDECITADVTKGYARIETYDGEIMIPDTNWSYLGLLTNTDNSYPFSVNQLDTYLTNHKNFYKQQNIDTAFTAGKSLITNGAKIVMGAVGLALPGLEIAGGTTLFSGINGLVNTGSDISHKYINNNLTLDDMRCAPEAYNNVCGVPFFNMIIAPLGLYLEEYSALNNELEMANDYMFMNGFTYNRIDNIKNNDNIRYYFNYVQAQIESILGITLSNDARNDIRQRFSNGIRFWNTDAIQYDMENYENWLVN